MSWTVHGFGRMRRSLIPAVLTTAFAVTFIPGLARAAGCGELDSVYHDHTAVNLWNDDILFNPGDELTSCNGNFHLTYQDNSNVVLYHIPSGQTVWQQATGGGQYTFYNYGYLDANTHFTAHLQVGDDGNLVVTRDADTGPMVEWTSDTQGTDCITAFITDAERERLATSVETGGANEPDIDGSKVASGIRSNVCSLFGVAAEEFATTIEEIAADVAGPAVLKGRTVVNEYKFYITFVQPDLPYKVPVGSARLQKTWYFDQHRVSNSGGSAPDKASLNGEAGEYAQLFGLHWGGVTGDSYSDGYAPWNGNGEGAHYSEDTASLKWEVPFASFIAYKPEWPQQLYIKGFADGHVECRGGNTCKGVGGP